MENSQCPVPFPQWYISTPLFEFLTDPFFRFLLTFQEIQSNGSRGALCQRHSSDFTSVQPHDTPTRNVAPSSGLAGGRSYVLVSNRPEPTRSPLHRNRTSCPGHPLLLEVWKPHCLGQILAEDVDHHHPSLCPLLSSETSAVGGSPNGWSRHLCDALESEVRVRDMRREEETTTHTRTKNKRTGTHKDTCDPQESTTTHVTNIHRRTPTLAHNTQGQGFHTTASTTRTHKAMSFTHVPVSSARFQHGHQSTCCHASLPHASYSNGGKQGYREGKGQETASVCKDHKRDTIAETVRYKYLVLAHVPVYYDRKRSQVRIALRHFENIKTSINSGRFGHVASLTHIDDALERTTSQFALADRRFKRLRCMETASHEV